MITNEFINYYIYILNLRSSMYFSKGYMEVTQNLKIQICVEKQKIILEDIVFEKTEK